MALDFDMNSGCNLLWRSEGRAHHIKILHTKCYCNVDKKTACNFRITCFYISKILIIIGPNWH